MFKYLIAIPSPITPGQASIGFCKNGIELDQYVKNALAIGVKPEEIAIVVEVLPK